MGTLIPWVSQPFGRRSAPTVRKACLLRFNVSHTIGEFQLSGETFSLTVCKPDTKTQRTLRFSASVKHSAPCAFCANGFCRFTVRSPRSYPLRLPYSCPYGLFPRNGFAFFISCPHGAQSKRTTCGRTVPDMVYHLVQRIPLT